MLCLSLPLKVCVLKHEVNKAFEIQGLNISWLFQNVYVDLLYKFDNFFFKDCQINPIFKPEIFNHLNQTSCSDLIYGLFVFFKSSAGDCERLFDCVLIYVAFMQLFVEFLMSFQKLLVLVYFPIFFPF